MSRKLPRLLAYALPALALCAGAIAWLAPFEDPPGWVITHESYIQRPDCQPERQMYHALLTLTPNIAPGDKDKLARIIVTSPALRDDLVANVSPDREWLHYPGLFGPQGHKETLRIACDAHGCRLSFLAYVAEYGPMAEQLDLMMDLQDSTGSTLSRHHWKALPRPKVDAAARDVTAALHQRITGLGVIGDVAVATLATPGADQPRLSSAAILQVASPATGRREAMQNLAPTQSGMAELALPLGGAAPDYLAVLLWQDSADGRHRHEAKLELIDKADPYMTCTDTPDRMPANE